jgi:hypothetical protein
VALSLTVSAGGTGRVTQVVVAPPPVAGMPFGGCVVQVLNGTTPTVHTGVRLRTSHLVSVFSTASRNYKAAWRDLGGNWSEWSAVKALAVGNYAAGVDHCAIASGVATDLTIEEPGVRFPDLSNDSTQGRTWRTVVTEGAFHDESRRQQWPTARSALQAVSKKVDSDQARLMHRFFKACNGPLKAFELTFSDPVSGTSRRGFYRFAEGTFSDTLVTVDQSDMAWAMVEIMSESDGPTI